MAKKKNNGGNGAENNTTNAGGGGGEKKEEDSVVTVVLKMDLHCEGCATKIKKSVRSFEGVEAVNGGGGELTKLTVIGKVDPAKIREGVEKKARKKVELISPLPPKKENNKDGNKENTGKGNNGGGGEKKGAEAEKKAGGDGGAKEGEKKGEENKKLKEPPVTTAVMKLNLHCPGCIKKIQKIVTKTKGYLDMSIDEPKNQMTVKGTMDMKALAKSLTDKLRKTVEIVPPAKKEADKKEKEKEKEQEKGKENNGGKDNNGGGGGGKGKGGGGGAGNGGGGGGGGENLIQYVQYGNQNPAMFEFGYGYPNEQFRAPQMFSDENPNACSVM